jgi:hypothetical protein
MHNDPNFNICPDYALDVFTNAWAQFINDNTTKEQVIQLLKNIWELNNNADKETWQC